MENTEARRRFDEQFVRSHIRIFRYIAALVPNRDDAEEVFQDTCLKILEKWQDYDPDRPMVPWACGIAQNMVRKFFERSRRRGAFLSEIAIAAVSETHDRKSSEVNRRLQELPGCLQKLTNQQRALLERCYQRPGSIKAIAEASQLDPNTLYKQLERIRRDLVRVHRTGSDGGMRGTEHMPKNKPAAVSPDLWRLASCACNGTLSPEDQARLEAILPADSSAREFYGFYMLMHAHLMWRFRGESATEDEIEDTRALLASTPTEVSAAPAPADLGPSLGQTLGASVFSAWNVLLSYAGSLLIFGIAVLGAFAWNRSDDRQIARRVSQPGAASLYVARITKAEGCYPVTPGPWAADGLRLRLGYECYVASGELEITYDTGVKVTLQGPAWYEVNSARSGALHHGTAVVSVGEQPDGRSPAPQVVAAPEIASHPSFILLVPLGVVTNQAAAYSLTVDELGAFYAKVQRGQIALQMPGWSPGDVVAVGATHSAVAFVQPSPGGGFQWQLTLSGDQPLVVDSNPRGANRAPVVFSGKYRGSVGKGGLEKPPGRGSSS